MCLPSRVYQTNREVYRLFSTYSSVAVQGDLWQGCAAAVRMLTDPTPAAGGRRAGPALLGLPGTQWGAWEGDCADSQEGNQEPLSRLLPSLAVLSSRRRVLHAQCLLALRKFSFVAARLKTVGCSCCTV